MARHSIKKRSSVKRSSVKRSSVKRSSVKRSIVSRKTKHGGFPLSKSCNRECKPLEKCPHKYHLTASGNCQYHGEPKFYPKPKESSKYYSSHPSSLPYSPVGLASPSPESYSSFPPYSPAALASLSPESYIEPVSSPYSPAALASGNPESYFEKPQVADREPLGGKRKKSRKSKKSKKSKHRISISKRRHSKKSKRRHSSSKRH
jgi:hypothetical protein